MEGSKNIQDSLAELGFTPRQVAGQLKLFSRDFKFLSYYNPSFQEICPNLWVAINHEVVVGIDKDLPSLLAFLKGKGVPISSLAI